MPIRPFSTKQPSIKNDQGFDPEEPASLEEWELRGNQENVSDAVGEDFSLDYQIETEMQILTQEYDAQEPPTLNFWKNQPDKNESGKKQ